jgi:hypothetical protein
VLKVFDDGDAALFALAEGQRVGLAIGFHPIGVARQATAKDVLGVGDGVHVRGHHSASLR